MEGDIERIFRSHYGAFCNFASKYVRDHAVVEDIVQDAFVTLLEKSPKFDTEGHLKNFLYVTIRNACLNYIRDEEAKNRYLEAQAKEENTENFEEEIILSEVYQELANAVADLPEECRKVFELCYFQGKDNSEAAEILGISVNTVRTQKARGKKILREKLKDVYPLALLLLDLLG